MELDTKKIMKWFERIKNLFKKKPDLRAQCIEAYGEEFGEMYDMVNMGQPIGNFEETVVFLTMIEAVKMGMPIKIRKKEEYKDDNRQWRRISLHESI